MRPGRAVASRLQDTGMKSLRRVSKIWWQLAAEKPFKRTEQPAAPDACVFAAVLQDCKMDEAALAMALVFQTSYEGRTLPFVIDLGSWLDATHTALATLTCNPTWRILGGACGQRSPQTVSVRHSCKCLRRKPPAPRRGCTGPRSSSFSRAQVTCPQSVASRSFAKHRTGCTTPGSRATTTRTTAPRATRVRTGANLCIIMFRKQD